MANQKIWYGVQGTGNGHISRARALLPEFKKAGADVTCYLTGRKPEEWGDTTVFGDHRIGKGMTFVNKNGKVDHLQTVVRHVRPRKFRREYHGLDFSGYDIIVTDYEPVTAHAARTSKREIVGIGNIYSALYDIPSEGWNPVTKAIMKTYAPATHYLPMHWHHFDQPILPPMTAPPAAGPVDPEKVLVYMNFESLEAITKLLRDFTDRHFHIYSQYVKAPSDEGNLSLRPLSRDGFRHDLATCGRVICNAGFELPTEVMALGKPVLVKPQEGQAEQISNGKALTQLGYGDTMKHFNAAAVGAFLKRDACVKIDWPPVAQAIAEWIVAGDYADKQGLVDKLWDQRTVTTVPAP